MVCASFFDNFIFKFFPMRKHGLADFRDVVLV